MLSPPVTSSSERQRTRSIPAQVIADLKDSPAIFSFDLRKIPVQADQIQRELNRTVWNGNIRLALRADNNSSFSKSCSGRSATPAARPRPRSTTPSATCRKR